MLSIRQIEYNYQQILLIADELLARRLQVRGYHHRPDSEALNDVKLSVAGNEAVVRLMTTAAWDRDLYLPVIERELEILQKELLPDLARKNVVSLEGNYDWLGEVVDETPESRPSAPDELETASLMAKIPPDINDYLNTVLLPMLGEDGPGFPGRIVSAIISDDSCLAKLKLLQRFFPEGGCLLSLPENRSATGDDQLKKAYILELLGIKGTLPANFLDNDGHRLSAVLVKFLIDEILHEQPEDILARNDNQFFARHCLQNVYRYFNYSTNRVIANAYPGLVQPWVNSKSDANYWNNRDHRVEAIRWLVECRLAINPAELYQAKIARNDFASNGLSYMFNQFYNSVSRALREAYPEFSIWELGKVPSSYWTTETGGEAIRWMINKCNWPLSELPALIRSGDFNRKTFSKFGLATLFERHFSRSIYQALDAAYPGRFQIWEVGKVPRDYWRSRKNIYRAACWVAGKEGIGPSEIPAALRRGKLGAAIFHKYGIPAVLHKWSGGDLSVAFAPALDNAYMVYRTEKKLLRKIRDLKTEHLQFGFIYYLVHGFFLADVHRMRKENARRYDRIARRIERRMEIA